MNNTSHDFDTFIELLRSLAVHQPDQRGYTFLVDGEIEEIHLTYGAHFYPQILSQLKGEEGEIGRENEMN